MKNIIRLSITVAVLVFSGLVQAIPIVVTATGVVSESRDDLDLFGFGSGSNTLLGAEITSTWLFDTDNLGPDIDSFSTAAYYFAQTNSVTSNAHFSKDGATSVFRLEDAIPSSDRDQDSVTVENEHFLGIDGYSVSDVKRVGTSILAVNAIMVRGTDDWIDSLLANQTINRTLSDLTSYNFGNAAGISYDIGNDRGYALYAINSFTVMPGSAPIPEPAGVFLLLFGMSGLVVTRRLKKS